MADPVREGDILAGKYKVERVIAQGGMGVVVAAIHQQLDQRVALKFMLPEGMQSEGALGRFVREAKAAVRLRSEHVARVLDVGTAETGSPYIVMEYLEGRDLSAVIEDEKRLSPAVAITYVLQAAEAIAEAHALGIVHRDLKPANLFLTKRADGTPCVKVLDFGISKLTNAGDVNLTKTSAVMGTPYYMAPEQLQSSKNVDLRSDIWSLGMILHELVTGVVAFQRDTLPGLCTAILFEPVRPMREVAPELPPALEEAVRKALEKNPADRYQDLGEFAAALSPLLPEGPALARRVSGVLGGARPTAERAPSRTAEPAQSAALLATARLDVAEPAPARAETLPTVARAPTRRLPWVAVALALGVVTIAGVLHATRSHDDLPAARAPETAAATPTSAATTSASTPPPTPLAEVPSASAAALAATPLKPAPDAVASAPRLHVAPARTAVRPTPEGAGDDLYGPRK